MANFPSPPADNTLIRAPEPKPGEKPKELIGYVSDPWLQWFRELVTAFGRLAQRLKTVAVVDQQASIATTPIPVGTLGATRYRLTYYARITRAATVSSSLIVTLSWLDGGVSCTYSGPAMVANTTSTVQAGMIEIDADPNSAISYSTTYASVGATTMKYKLTVSADALP